MNLLRNLSVGAKLWSGVALIILALLGTVASAGLRSARLNDESSRVLTQLSEKTALAVEWAGITETTTTRVQASMLSSDPLIAHTYKDLIPAGSARISELQKRLEAMALTEAEKAQLAKIAEARKAVLESLGKANAHKKNGEDDLAATEIRMRFNGLVTPYLNEIKAFAQLQATLLAET